ncbi:hypothetical protein G9A89_020467 [Geosiphon pyriformis]|nr:hypothetical protein G9A89_020467 [Geosiphon pyriformis]
MNISNLQLNWFTSKRQKIFFTIFIITVALGILINLTNVEAVPIKNSKITKRDDLNNFFQHITSSDNSNDNSGFMINFGDQRNEKLSNDNYKFKVNSGNGFNLALATGDNTGNILPPSNEQNQFFISKPGDTAKDLLIGGPIMIPSSPASSTDRLITDPSNPNQFVLVSPDGQIRPFMLQFRPDSTALNQQPF